jgi:hypothetical protein
VGDRRVVPNVISGRNDKDKNSSLSCPSGDFVIDAEEKDALSSVYL